MNEKNTQAEAPSEREIWANDIMSLAHRWANATYNKALDKPYEDFDVLQKKMRAALATQQAVQGEAVGDERWWSPPDSFGTNWLTNGAALHPLTANLVVRFARALAAKLAAAEIKYGYSDGWRSADWMDECRAKLAEHVAKGDPRDVAAYCAFLWHHGESTATPPAPQQPEALAQQERDREDADYLCKLVDAIGKDVLGVLKQYGDAKAAIGLMASRTKEAIRAARSSEGGKP